MGDELLGIRGIVVEQRRLRREEFPGKRRITCGIEDRITCGIETCRAEVVLTALGLAQEERVVRWKHLETRRQVGRHDDLGSVRRMRRRDGECGGESGGACGE